MTGWLIFFGIILFILGILMIPVHAEARYKEDFSLKIRCLFFLKFQIIPMKEKKKKRKSQRKKNRKPKKSQKSRRKKNGK